MQYSIAKILKNIFSLSAGHVIVQILTVVTGILIARYLGKTQFGQYSTIIVYVGLFSVFCELGASIYLVREGARQKTAVQENFGTILLISIVICSVIYVIMLSVLPATGYSLTVSNLIILFGIGLFFLQFQKTFYALLQVNQKQHLQAMNEVFSTSLRLMLYVGVIYFGLGLKGIVFSNLFGTILSICLIGILVFSTVQRPKINLQIIPAILKGSYLFGLSGVFTFAYFQSDTLMLSLMRSPSEVGLYSAAYKLVILGNEIPVIVINSVLLPFMFSFGLISNDKLLIFYKTSGKYLLMLGFPLSVSLLLLSKELIGFLYGIDFVGAASALEILAFALVIRFMSSCAGAVLTSLDRMRLKVIIQASLAAGNILLNLFFIKRFGYVGAAITTLMTEVALVIIYFRYSGKYLERVSFVKDFKLIQIAISSAMMGVFLYFTRELIILPALVIGGAIIYFFCLYWSGFLSREDRQTIYRVMSKQLEMARRS
jgi:O-antigen/teichoic acid export membrane protein